MSKQNTIFNAVNAGIIKMIVRFIKNGKFLYLLLSKDKINTATATTTYEDIRSSDPNVLLLNNILSDADGLLTLCYDTGDSNDYDKIHVDKNVTPFVTRYLKFVDENDSTALNNMLLNYNTDSYYLYIRKIINWKNISEEILSSLENYYESVMLLYLYHNTENYLTNLPPNGVNLLHEYDDEVGVNYQFDKEGDFKHIFEFVIKFNIGDYYG